MSEICQKNVGKESKLKSLCDRAIENGNERCLLLCFPHHGINTLKMVPIDSTDDQDLENPEIDLRAQVKWWKRFSIYTFTRITEVEHGNSDAKVITWPADHAKEIRTEKVRRDAFLKQVTDHFACGVRVDGSTYDEKDPCPNSVYDSDSEEKYCPVLEALNCGDTIDSLRHRPEYLDFIWKDRAGRAPLDFLASSGLIYNYSYLSQETFRDARSRYGSRLRALQVVNGWQVSYIIWISLVTVCVSIVAAALMMLTGQTWEAGLAVGGYVLTAVTVFAGILSAISALT